MGSRRDRDARRSRPGEAPSVAPSVERRTARALTELSRLVSSDWDASIRRIVEFEAEALDVDRVSFWSLCEETSSIHCEAGYVASVQSFEHGATLFAHDLPEYFDALREARTLSMSDVRTDARCHGLRDYCASRGITSMLDIPVWVEGRLSGVLCHEHVGAMRRWSGQEEDFATSVSQVVSSALAARAHTRAEAAARRAAFLDRVSRTLSSLDSREIGRRAVSLAVQRFAELSMLWVLNRDGLLECVAFEHRDSVGNGIVSNYLLRGGSTSPREGTNVASRVVRQGQSLLIPDMTEQLLERYGVGASERTAIASLALTTAIAVPLTMGGRTLGAMTFLASDRRYDADDLALAETIADRVASALENARLYEVAREAVRARDELLVLTAHELRTPVTALQLRAEHQLRKARREAGADEVARSEAMARDVRRFSALVDRVLEALNIRAEGLSLTCSACDLGAIAHERVDLIASRARAAGSTIGIDTAPTVVGRWDRTRVEHVVDVLLENAVKFGSGGPIRVSVRSDLANAELSVGDHGIGIPSDRLTAIFDPFERAAPKEHFGGMGLGLYIAKAIVEAHGGSIAATSGLGAGSTFVVRLPLASATCAGTTGP